MMLHNALDRAVKEKLILTNPTENCIIPKIEKQEMKILHPDHISSYLNAAERRNALPMFYLELVSGLRKGELVALQWSDLDEANCTISVSKQASWDTEHQLILSRPKTGNSIREVSIPQDAVELLKQEHAKHPDNPWMFPSGRTGGMYHPDSVVTLHKRILKDAGLEHIRFHDLRHTFATLALQNGVDVKTVSSMLGHYDAGFTLRIYTHATRQKQDEAAQTMLFQLDRYAIVSGIIWCVVGLVVYYICHAKYGDSNILNINDSITDEAPPSPEERAKMDKEYLLWKSIVAAFCIIAVLLYVIPLIF